MIQPLDAAILGAVEGLTEFLPVSSTGHLILAARLLRLQGEAVKTFEVIIQGGALAAVLGLYRHQVRSMWRGLLGRDRAGRTLLANLLVSFLPSAVAGVLLHRIIKARLFAVWPVTVALAIGGALMIGVARWLRRAPRRAGKSIETLTLGDALVIGGAQCVALWPGASRSMVTIVAGLLRGLPASAAAEYSFLLALPTLGAAAVFDLLKGGGALGQGIGWLSGLCGFAAAGVVAGLAIRALTQYLTRRGLAPFGWYRLGLSAVVWWTFPR